MRYRFGTFEFDQRDGELRRDGRRVPLEPKPARALALLLERAGEIVTRDELRAQLWDPGTHVDFDRALAYCLSQVRQALGDSAENPRFVQTVPRRGFKFISPVTTDVGSGPSGVLATPPVTPSAPTRRRLIPIAAGVAAIAVAAIAWGVVQGRSSSTRPIVAVALFDNETGDPAYGEALSRMTDAVVERLTSLGADRVGVVGNHPRLRQPRPSRDLDAIGRDTNASYVILVQLQRRDAELSLLLQLIQMSDGVHIWVRRMALAAGDVDRADDEVAERIEAAVRRFALGEHIEAP